MGEFIIPTSFSLFARKINVVFREDLSEDCECIGRVNYRKNLIELQPGSIGSEERTDVIDTFFHELIHFLLYAMGERELKENEKFVDVLGRLLHQALTSMEYHVSVSEK